MRLTRGVFDDGTAVRQRRGEDDVHRRADRYLVKIDARAVQLAVRRFGIDEAVAHVDVGSERRHALDMLLDRTDAEIAAAGHRGLGAAEAAEHRADEVIRRADLARQIERRVDAANARAVDLDGRFVDKANLSAEVAEDRQQHIGIADLGNIFDPADAVDQKRRGDDRDSGVFRPADLHFAAQCRAAVDNILFHVIAPFRHSGFRPIVDSIIHLVKRQLFCGGIPI